jgi:hypothetical protein
MNKNTIKIFTFFFLSAVGFPTFAQGVIYKCVDADGDVSYTTEVTNKNCEKTNLAKIDKGSIINKPAFVSTPTSSSNAEPTVANSEQVVRDQKRVLILQNELQQEKSQLKTVSDMLEKANHSDQSQLEQLKKMEQTHKRNIASLEKELGVKGDIQLNATQKTNNIPNGLPFNLPKDANEVQLVETPKMQQNSQQYVPKTPYTMVNSFTAPKPSGNFNPSAQQQAQAQVQPQAGVNPVAKINQQTATPNTPYVLINPGVTAKTVNDNSAASVAIAPQVQPEIIREYRQPAAITNKSIKKKVTLPSQSK